MGRNLNIQLFDPSLIKEFYSQPEHIYKKIPMGGLTEKLFGEGLLRTEGALWK